MSVSFTFNALSPSFFLFLFPIAVFSSSHDCSYSSRCTTYSGPTISFPFRTPDQPKHCGLPGFDLLCDTSNRKPLLSLPSGQIFTVESVDYYSKEIRIGNPEGCLQEKLMHFNSSGTPFYVNYFTNFTLFNCSSSSRLPTYYYLYWRIACLSAPTYSVICYSYNSSDFLSYGCELIGEVRVPGSWSSSEFSRSARSVYLSWELPDDCVRCQAKGGECQRDPIDFKRIRCSPPPRYTYPPSKDVSGIVIPSIFLPILLALICATCILCKKMQSRTGQAMEGSGGVTTTSTEQTRMNQQSIVASGLEQGTLDTYPTVLIGGSGRMLTIMEDKTCPICLSDYEQNETLKILPECLHRFHGDCIDEWLRAKALCPVCRTPPPRRSS